MNDTTKPMDNNEQAVDIKGYRILNEAEKDAMNILKKYEQQILDELKVLSQSGGLVDVNQRSLALGITNIQTGFMWAIRAIARPNGE